MEDGLLSPETLNTAAVRIIELILRAGQRQPFTYDKEAHHQLARRAAAESAVLLKNEENILPGNPDQKAAVIGVFAKQPRYQGTGSSKIVPIKLDNACEELAKLGLEFTYADGYKIESDETDQFLIDQACDIAKDKEIVYVFAGLPDRYEAESFDRDNMQLPESHNQLITRITSYNVCYTKLLRKIGNIPDANSITFVLADIKKSLGKLDEAAQIFLNSLQYSKQYDSYNFV